MAQNSDALDALLDQPLLDEAVEVYAELDDELLLELKLKLELELFSAVVFPSTLQRLGREGCHVGKRGVPPIHVAAPGQGGVPRGQRGRKRHDAHTITKYGRLVRPDTQVVVVCAHCA